MAFSVPEIAPQAKLDQCRTVRNTGDRCLPQQRAGGARHLRNPLTEYLQYQRDGHQLAIGSDLAWADNQLPAVVVGGHGAKPLSGEQQLFLTGWLGEI